MGKGRDIGDRDKSTDVVEDFIRKFRPCTRAAEGVTQTSRADTAAQKMRLLFPQIMEEERRRLKLESSMEDPDDPHNNNSPRIDVEFLAAVTATLKAGEQAGHPRYMADLRARLDRLERGQPAMRTARMQELIDDLKLKLENSDKPEPV